MLSAAPSSLLFTSRAFVHASVLSGSCTNSSICNLYILFTLAFFSSGTDVYSWNEKFINPKYRDRSIGIHVLLEAV